MGRSRTNQPWTAEEDEWLFRMAVEKVLQSRIAVALNRSPGAIKSRLKVLRAAAQKNVEPPS
jgi:hypothetical protein